MIILYLESGIRQKLKVWKAILKSRKYVEKINVFEGKKIEIVYRFQDELVTAARLAEQIGKTKQEVAV